jgi:pyrroloquinoline quinone biosynthesis protein D
VTRNSRPKLAKGIRLHRDRDGRAMLLVPEGALVLNASAAATLELVDGRRSIGDIADAVVERFDVREEQAREDVCRLIGRLAERRFLDAEEP